MLKTCLCIAALLAIALAVLALRPDDDLAVARVFFLQNAHRFVGDTASGVAVRYILWELPFALLAVMVLCAFASRLGLLPTRFALSGRGLAFLVGTLLLAPGLLVHVTLKEHSHRPRPYDVTALVGRHHFARSIASMGPAGTTAPSHPAKQRWRPGHWRRRASRRHPCEPLRRCSPCCLRY